MSFSATSEVLNSISNLYSLDNFTDVTLVVEGQELKAHKLILASRNEVLNAMLTKDMAENKKNVVEITDCDITTFKVFLKYLYTGVVKDENLTLELMILADKYLDQTLKDACESFLQKDINLVNAIDKILVANSHGCQKLKESTAAYIAENIEEFMENSRFEEILDCKDLIKSIFKKSKALQTNSPNRSRKNTLYCTNCRATHYY